MKNRLLLSAALVLAGAANVHAALQGEGYSRNENLHTVFQHAQYELYFNNSGSTLTSGTVVILDVSGSGVNGATVSGDGAGRSAVDVSGSDGDVDNIGTYITTTTSADVDTVAGVVDDNSCPDQSYCLVQTRGPRRVRCADSTDAVTVSAAVGTTTVAGNCGGGSGLGRALEAGNGQDDGVLWVDILLGMGSN
jgi:hypothetical protein